ncbi:MAG: hypothetical protein RLZZ244_216 [Verrucomicrobiota bacterium]
MNENRKRKLLGRGVVHRRVVVTVRLSSAMKRALKRVSDDQRRSMNAQVMMFIEEGIRSYDEV